MHDINDTQRAVTAARFQTILQDIIAERGRQDERWGEQNHPPQDWMMILQEELGEVARAHMEIYYNQGPASEEGREAWAADFQAKRRHLRTELIQAAAVAMAMVECGDRNNWWPGEEL